MHLLAHLAVEPVNQLFDETEITRQGTIPDDLSELQFLSFIIGLGDLAQGRRNGSPRWPTLQVAGFTRLPRRLEIRVSPGVLLVFMHRRLKCLTARPVLPADS